MLIYIKQHYNDFYFGETFSHVHNFTDLSHLSIDLYSGFSGPNSHVRLISEHFGMILTYVPLILISIHTYLSFLFLSIFKIIFFGIPNV